MLKLLILTACVYAVYCGGYQNEPCSGGSCPVQFSEMHFRGSVLHAKLTHNNVDTVKGGRLVMTTEGYGCILFLCAWGEGPTLDDPTCDWPGMSCDANGDLFSAGERDKAITMDFREALEEAKGTTGCCEVDKSCKGTPGPDGCMLRGVATFDNGEEYAKVRVEFTCDLNAYTCTLE